MKLYFLFAILISGRAFGFDLCQYESTSDFLDLIEAGKGKQTHESSNHKKFTEYEKNLIYTTIRLERDYRDVSKYKALIIFGDFDEGSDEPGSDAGTIRYFTIGKERIVMVHYWPGENEYGAFYQIKADKTEMIASIGDGSIECK